MLLISTFARVAVALHMNVEDYYPLGKRWWVRLQEKGGKRHEMPAHHPLETYVDANLTAAGIGAWTRRLPSSSHSAAVAANISVGSA